MDANQLIDNFKAAKAALWEYLSTEEDTYLHLDIYDFRHEKWTGDPTSDGLAWGWSESNNDWEYKNVLVKSVVYKDGLTFVWYSDGGPSHWAVFSNEKSQVQSV